ncbi:MAG: BLUF domain-containing protein [Pseudomonadota bacterium]
MLDDRADGAVPDPEPGGKHDRGQDDLVALSYKSRPVTEFSASDRARLLQQARHNNSELEVSGVIVIGADCIYQWLEGPTASVDALIERIGNDPRHRDVEILERYPIRHRLFEPWTMLLATDRGDESSADESAVSVPESSISDMGDGAFKRHGMGKISKLVRESLPDIDTRRAASVQITNTSMRDVAMSGSFGHQLRDRLGAKIDRANSQSWDLAASALATLLLEDEYSKVEHFLRSLTRREADPLPLQVSLMEQAERRLGDLWLEDFCSDVDVESALTDLIRALRNINFGTLPIWRAPIDLPRVLVVSQPGELHMLPAVLDAEVLWQHGWSPVLEFPKRDEDLQQLLSEQWFEVLDISMSGVFRRADRLEGLTKTVELARAASANRQIVVTVGGRAISEDRSLLIEIGADAAVNSARDVETAIYDAIKSAED